MIAVFIGTVDKGGVAARWGKTLTLLRGSCGNMTTSAAGMDFADDCTLDLSMLSVCTRDQYWFSAPSSCAVRGEGKDAICGSGAPAKDVIVGELGMLDSVTS